MDDNQRITLQTYNEHADRYVSGTRAALAPDGVRWVDDFLKLLDANAIILEIGSGTGRDANLMERRGFQVIRTDGAQGMVEYMTSQGHLAKLYNPLLGSFSQRYDAIVAGAVLLHFNEAQLRVVLENILSNLPANGPILIWTKSGKGDEVASEKMNSPRYFK